MSNWRKSGDKPYLPSHRRMMKPWIMTSTNSFEMNREKIISDINFKIQQNKHLQRGLRRLSRMWKVKQNEIDRLGNLKELITGTIDRDKIEKRLSLIDNQLQHMAGHPPLGKALEEEKGILQRALSQLTFSKS